MRMSWGVCWRAGPTFAGDGLGLGVPVGNHIGTRRRGKARGQDDGWNGDAEPVLGQVHGIVSLSRRMGRVWIAPLREVDSRCAPWQS